MSELLDELDAAVACDSGVGCTLVSAALPALWPRLARVGQTWAGAFVHPS